MPKSEKYIMSSDYATLRNDSDTTTITISIPATAIGAGAGNIQTYTGTGTVGTAGSPMEYDINYSLTTHRFKTTNLQFIENVGAADQYQGVIMVYKTAANTVTAQVSLFSGGGATKTARTVTVRVRTFIPPFA